MDDAMQIEIFTPPLSDIPTAATQKVLNMFFIVDTSGSMQGERIDAVNQAFQRMVPELCEVQRKVNAEFELRIAIMTFNQGANWIVSPTPILQYAHSDIPCSRFVTFYSEAFRSLNEKLSRNAYMSHTGKIAAPYIMFMTDGAPTPTDQYEAELTELDKNGWYQVSQRYAVLIGKGAIQSPEARNAVRRFVTNEEESIIDAPDAETIAKGVQAQTLHTINVMTKRGAPNVSASSGGNLDGGPSPFGDISDFPDDSDGIFI